MTAANELEAARRLHEQGRLVEAEQAYQRLSGTTAHRQPALHALSQLYLQMRRPMQAVQALTALNRDHPDRFLYCAQLAELLDSLGHLEAAIDHYEAFLRRQPDLASAHFNLARLYRRSLMHQRAIEAYENAIRLGIDNAQEVYSNLGVVYAEMRKPDSARQMYERALDIDPGYIPALFNLATLHEEAGQRQRAVEFYEQILRDHPRHWDSLARLGYAQRIESPGDALIGRLRTAADQATDAPLAREGLYFALGKVLDDAGQYREAFQAYRTANELGRKRLPRYQKQATEQAVSQLIALFDRDWIESHSTSVTASPVFVCGMFRSGSTLVERMLGAHPAVTAGGELDFLPWLIARRLSPYPQRAHAASAAELVQIADEYLARVRDLFPEAAHVTDKRPDNFLHLGLVRAMFPAAKIVYTKRNMADNCLSMYFQQLGGKLAHTADLADTAHYYRQHERLMRHWQTCLGERIHTVVYDDLVRTPEAVLRALLVFLGLEWDERCLEFQQAAQPVRTASVWQVREGLHRASSGRWKHYAPVIDGFDALFAPEGPGARV